VTQSHMDDNDRARFVDGLMPETERNATVAHLAASEEEAALLADVAYMLADLDPEGGVVADEDDDADAVPVHAGVDTGTDAKVVPLRPPSTRRGWRRAPARWMALAAMVAGVLLVPLALSRSGSSEPGDFAVLLANREQGLPQGFADRDRWSVTRGGETAADNALAARLGALQVDLELAAAAGQAGETQLLSDAIASRVDDVPGAGMVAAAYRNIGTRAGEPAQALAGPLAEARESLALFVDEDHFSLGAWTEAAALAVERRDAAFFRRRASRKMMDRAALLRSLEPEARGALEAIRTAARSDQPDWTVLKTQTDALLRQIGS
jgi:hypothetical protein